MTMQAYQIVESHKAELREVAVPEPGPGQVLVKIGGAGACHSDLHLMEAPPDRLPALPFTLGHENAGWVEKLGRARPGSHRATPCWCTARGAAAPARAAG